MVEKQIIKETKHKDYDYLVVKITPDVPENLINVLENLTAILSEMTNPWFNGYVVLPKGHRYSGVHYNDIPVDCHGGLTFGAYDNNGDWIIGFDCRHSGDNYLVQDADYVESECKSIIEQLIELEN